MASKYEKNIMEIFGRKESPEVTKERLLLYKNYLLDNLDADAILTGREDFPWEEFYIFGPGDSDEYEELKKERPSYTDEYKLIGISNQEVHGKDLIAKTRRLSDEKIFEIGLSWLSAKNKKNKDYQLLDDFATWVVNW